MGEEDKSYDTIVSIKLLLYFIVLPFSSGTSGVYPTVAVLNYGVSDAVVNGIAMPFTTQSAKLSLYEVGGMNGVDTTV